MDARMTNKNAVANEIINFPVAIRDKELLKSAPFHIQLFELCTICGARFGIGYHGVCPNDAEATETTEGLPGKLTAILAKDHRQNREHNSLIELEI